MVLVLPLTRKNAVGAFSAGTFINKPMTSTSMLSCRAQPSARQPPVYMDLASLGALPKYTCGQLYYYAAFSPKRDAQRLAHDVTHNLTRPTAWEVRTRKP